MLLATRFLLLCTALLVLPTIAAPQSTPLTVRVWTRDAGGSDKATFALGEAIHVTAQVNNSYGGYLLAANGTQLTVSTNPSFYNNTMPADLPPGISTWAWHLPAPSTRGSYIVTVKAYDHFYGAWTESSASFTIGGPSPLADLSPTPIRYNSADLVRGKTVFFDSGVQNAGSQGTGVFNIRWFVDGVSVGYGSHAGVSANSIVLDGNSGYSWVAVEGIHTITFSVNVDNHVAESNDSNNSQSVTVTVADSSPHFSTVPEGKAPNLLVLVHGCCTDASDVKDVWYYLGGLIMNQLVKHNPTPTDWEIVVWNWSTYTPKYIPGEAYRNAEHESIKLANAIAANAVTHPYSYVHFIGHSAGARLIDLTAKTLAKMQSPPFIHLTFLDAYTPNPSDTATYGSITSPHYSEQYVTRGDLAFTEACLPYAFNFDITGWMKDDKACNNIDPFIDPFCAHNYPVQWYTNSVTSAPPTRFIYGYPLSYDGGNSQYSLLSMSYPDTMTHPNRKQCALNNIGTSCTPAACW